MLKQTLLIWLVAGMLLASVVRMTMSAKVFAQSSTIALNGAGATFLFPLIDAWRVEYQKVKSDVTLNYQSIGSGGGIKQFTEKTMDFGATDAPLTTAQRERRSLRLGSPRPTDDRFGHGRVQHNRRP
jgi:phosphate transport system substrate-binding protein